MVDQRDLLVRIADQVGEGVGVFDVDDRLLYANAILAELNGCSAEELIGQHVTEFFTGPQEIAALTEVRTAAEALGDGILRAQMSSFRSDGSRLDIDVTVSSLTDDNGQRIGRIVCVRDVSSRRQLEERLERAALHDPLTDLPNRRLLADRLEHALAVAERTNRPVAVLFIDLDGFKGVNDAHGHEAGDQLLTQTAARLRACLRQGDTLARLGGDEFVVLLEDVMETPQPMTTAKRLIRAISSPFDLGGISVGISASIGIALSTSGSQRRLLHAADNAMYEAKSTGPGGIVQSEAHQHPDPASRPIARRRLRPGEAS